ncbi:cAMP-binding domain of CRP or a regulatory subunit of cAMP-dependent protein kinases [Andreprevotia lacus DSM 23236]|uniref:cAMP-binding domain of CRP or a regulatory subunit of cAMP-dependent protein kinases n=1 Tax=Andreprevotia lacus DSM 23236 TaxID=1121001 RepID=A0A1W1XY88_9NEIS|nr:Crp/Fnr family transcriptional regulator [Andreprevotia lacus]SMC28468.1 cAMP-binding domain of CRP or a regulatory subunit of cAMP-dependent protein kinases [Andreprevotia lacus DSM 23236]
MARTLDIRGLLQQLPLFKNLAERQLEQLAHSCEQCRFDRNQFVFHRGDSASGLYVVAVGRIKLSIPSGQGQAKVVELCEAGQSFGEAGMFLGLPYLVEAQALEDSLLIRIARAEIERTIDSDPSFARRMLVSLSMHVDAMLRDIEAINLQNAMQRVISYLLAQPMDNGRVRLVCSKHVVASKLGLTPETLSRQLHQLVDLQLIRVCGGDVQILDESRLKAWL